MTDVTLKFVKKYLAPLSCNSSRGFSLLLADYSCFEVFFLVTKGQLPQVRGLEYPYEKEWVIWLLSHVVAQLGHSCKLRGVLS